MFKIIAQWKIWAVIGALVAGMFGYIKILSARNEKLRHDNLIKDELKAIHEQQLADESEALGNEIDQVAEEIQNRLNLNKSDRFNKL